jgi:hypothetical protein
MLADILLPCIISVIIIHETTDKEVRNHVIPLCSSGILQMDISEALPVLRPVLSVFIIKGGIIREEQVDVL